MQHSKEKLIDGIPQEKQHWCVYKNKNVKHTYYLHSIAKTPFGRICTECDLNCNSNCEWKKDSL